MFITLVGKRGVTLVGNFIITLVGNFITLVGIITLVGKFITLVGVITSKKFYYTCGSEKVTNQNLTNSVNSYSYKITFICVDTHW